MDGRKGLERLSFRVRASVEAVEDSCLAGNTWHSCGHQ